MKRYAAAICLLLFATLASARDPEIVQLSPDTYMISRADHGGIFGGGLPKLTVKVIKQANEFAAKQGKIAIPLASVEHPMGGGPAQWATFEYQFRVVDKNDPEARRTSLQPSANVVVKMEQPAQSTTPAAAKPDLYSELLKLDDLRKRGIITESEFQAQKAKLLAQ
jgi:hypothetical protein